MRARALVFIAAAGLMFSARAGAHHAFASEFDGQKPVTLDGVVTQLELVNPHTWVHVDVKNADGTTTHWMVEAGSPNVLFRQGFTKNTVPPGTRVTVDGFQARDGSNRINGKNIKLPNGQRLMLTTPGAGGAPEDDKAPK